MFQVINFRDVHKDMAKGKEWVSPSFSNEVFESLDEPMSSRTVSQDKISTITEVSQESGVYK